MAGSAGIQPLTELHIFRGAQRVAEALAHHDCGPALAWCEEHRPRLRKAKSRLEFKLRVQVWCVCVWCVRRCTVGSLHFAPAAAQLQPLPCPGRGSPARGSPHLARARALSHLAPCCTPPLAGLQEFVELVRGGRHLEAVAYARRHLAPWATAGAPPHHLLPELQRAAALLAFPDAGSVCEPYHQLLQEERVGGCECNQQPIGCKRTRGSATACLPPSPCHFLLRRASPVRAPCSPPRWKQQICAAALVQWRDLGGLFLQELYRLHCLPPTSLLTIHLQARALAARRPAARCLPSRLRAFTLRRCWLAASLPPARPRPPAHNLAHHLPLACRRRGFLRSRLR